MVSIGDIEEVLQIMIERIEKDPPDHIYSAEFC